MILMKYCKIPTRVMSQQVKLRYIGEGLLIYAKLLKLEVIIVLNCHYTLQESYITFI